ncbi:ABC transporter permease [Christensenella timonensis]|uniref:ABC transporter permease n=1 Tax=Christensenella timonensis TaxID=1816678 RepID=UPI00082F1E82|nr:ABC transporter permease subunit [Christensenella timonensis]
MKYLYKKEMAVYFTTPFGYIFLGVFLILSGIMFTIYNLLGGNGDMAGTFDLLKNFAFIIFPVLTMKLFAEERQAGTEMVLATSKLKMTDIVLGKFFAALTLFAIALAATFVYVGIIAAYGDPNFGALMSSYLGFFLLGMAMSSVCLFISSLVDNQITAAIASFGLLFFMVLLASFTKSMTIPVLTPMLSAIAITVQYDQFTLGVLSLGPVCYYIGLTVVFVLLTIKSMEKRRFN